MLETVFRPSRDGPPVPPSPKEIPTQGSPCGFYGTAVDREAAESRPVKGSTQVDDGAHPLFAGGVCFNGQKGALVCFALLDS